MSTHTMQSMVPYQAVLVGIVVAALQTQQSDAFRVHNPSDVDVHTVHIVQSAHLDIGCKTFGCSERLLPGEPDLCLGNHVEPYAYHIVNRWLDKFLLRAVANANATRGAPNGPIRHMVQPWIVSIMLDCDGAEVVSWPGSGWPAGRPAAPTLHCPNATVVAEIRAALQRGDLFLHGFPHNGEAAAFPDQSLFDAALAMPQYLSHELGIAPPTAVSQRDVPGWTRATIPLLARRGIIGLSIGAGQPPGMPDVPPLFVWRDLPSGTEVVVTYESGYGEASRQRRANATAFVLPNGVAMAAGWSGDNSGPADVATSEQDFAAMRALFPNATVIKSSTFDAFFKVANQPDVKALLPVITSEIGDGWIYGVPSDPLKNAMFREAARQRRSCVEAGKCDPTSLAMRRFDRLLSKVPEHTWGVASQVFFPDYTNWSNPRFDAARAAQQPHGFLNNTSVAQADYNTTVNSWLEQRTFITNAPKVLAADHPSLATTLVAAFEDLRNVNAPPTIGLTRVARDASARFNCSGHKIGFDGRGAITTLQTRDGTAWASTTQPLGLYEYQTFDNEDYNIFLQDFASRVDGPGCGGYSPGSADDSNCKNFRKPNVSSASPKHRVINPTVTDIFYGRESAGICRFVVEMTMDNEAHLDAGAPERVITEVIVKTESVSWDVVQINKRPTRLPEAVFFKFNPVPAALAPTGYRLQVLGSNIEPTDVVGNSPSNATKASYGGSPHLVGIEAVTWSHPESGVNATTFPKLPQLGLNLTSLDVGIVSVGAATPFPTPRTTPPNMTEGISFNIFQNIWNTNYVLWYPFDAADASIRSRFNLNFTSSPW